MKTTYAVETRRIDGQGWYQIMETDSLETVEKVLGKVTPLHRDSYRVIKIVREVVNA